MAKEKINPKVLARVIGVCLQMNPAQLLPVCEKICSGELKFIPRNIKSWIMMPKDKRKGYIKKFKALISDSLQ